METQIFGKVRETLKTLLFGAPRSQKSPLFDKKITYRDMDPVTRLQIALDVTAGLNRYWEKTSTGYELDTRNLDQATLERIKGALQRADISTANPDNSYASLVIQGKAAEKILENMYELVGRKFRERDFEIQHAFNKWVSEYAYSGTLLDNVINFRKQSRVALPDLEGTQKYGQEQISKSEIQQRADLRATEIKSAIADEKLTTAAIIVYAGGIRWQKTPDGVKLDVDLSPDANKEFVINQKAWLLLAERTLRKEGFIVQRERDENGLDTLLVKGEGIEKFINTQYDIIREKRSDIVTAHVTESGAMTNRDIVSLVAKMAISVHDFRPLPERISAAQVKKANSETVVDNPRGSSKTPARNNPDNFAPLNAVDQSIISKAILEASDNEGLIALKTDDFRRYKDHLAYRLGREGGDFDPLEAKKVYNTLKKWGITPQLETAFGSSDEIAPDQHVFLQDKSRKFYSLIITGKDIQALKERLQASPETAQVPFETEATTEITDMRGAMAGSRPYQISEETLKAGYKQTACTMEDMNKIAEMKWVQDEKGLRIIVEPLIKPEYDAKAGGKVTPDAFKRVAYEQAQEVYSLLARVGFVPDNVVTYGTYNTTTCFRVDTAEKQRLLQEFLKENDREPDIHAVPEFHQKLPKGMQEKFDEATAMREERARIAKEINAQREIEETRAAQVDTQKIERNPALDKPTTNIRVGTARKASQSLPKAS